MKASTDAANGELVLERDFDAPRETVYKAFTERQRIDQWWGPKPYDARTSEMDVRPGGVWLYCMCGPAGEQEWIRAVFREVVPSSRLAYETQFVDATGNVLTEMPQMHMAFDFHDVGAKTRLILTVRCATPEELQQILDLGMVPGTAQCFDQLDEQLRAGALNR